MRVGAPLRTGQSSNSDAVLSGYHPKDAVVPCLRWRFQVPSFREGLGPILLLAPLDSSRLPFVPCQDAAEVRFPDNLPSPAIGNRSQEFLNVCCLCRVSSRNRNCMNRERKKRPAGTANLPIGVVAVLCGLAALRDPCGFSFCHWVLPCLERAFSPPGEMGTGAPGRRFALPGADMGRPCRAGTGSA